jgi:hypothetical protein
MEPTINLGLALPLSQAERVLALVKSFGSAESKDEGSSSIASEEQDDDPAVPSPLRFTPVAVQRPPLKYLLDGRREIQVVRFILQKRGNFFNDELAADLGIDDSRLTSGPLGRITKMLRKIGVRAEGFRGTNWYKSIPSSGRTMIIVRDDVLPILAEALES